MPAQRSTGDPRDGGGPRSPNRSREPRIALGADVRRLLSAHDVAELMAGRLVPLDFECFVCGRPGEARTTPASIVVWTGGRIAGQRAQMFALTHAHCADSGVRRGAPDRRARWGWPPRWRRTLR